MNKYTESRSRIKKGINVLYTEGLFKFITRFSWYLKRLFRRKFSFIIIPLLQKKTFEFNGRKLRYFYHKHNLTWTNERAVEIAVIRDYLNQNFSNIKDPKILEVGAVLPHYYNYPFDVLDKFEKGSGIINEDVVSFKSEKKYDLIISISTLEHVGFDDDDKDPMKILKAFDNLKKCLNKYGKIIFTVPLGYNPDLDKLIFNDELKLSEQYFLKRYSGINWKQINKEQAKGAKYGIYNSLSATVIVFGIINN